MNPRTIVIGDVHGCIDELRELAKLVDYRMGKDRLVLVGDLIDRGPEPRRCVRWAIEHNAEVVRANHEAKLIEFRQKEARALAGGPANGMERPEEPRMSEWMSFTSEELTWMDKLPAWLDLGNNWICVHAGLEPKPLSDQKFDRVIRVRWVDEKTGEFVGQKKIIIESEIPHSSHNTNPRPLTAEQAALREARQAARVAKGLPAVVENTKKVRTYLHSLEQPDGTVPWYEAWHGPQNVIYGHAAQKGSPHVFHHKDIQTIGIDTGCVFGYNLSCAIFQDGKSVEFASVKAKKKYYEWPKDGC